MSVKKIAVIGAGLMGSQIARTVANFGFEVTIFSRRGPSALARLQESVKKAVVKKILTETQAAFLLSNIHFALTLAEAVKEADLVIEAVVEDLDVKEEVFRQVSVNCDPDAIISSNTSSLSISSLAEVVKGPQRVVGMHFFNPAPVMKLVEVVQASQTSKKTVDSIVNFCEKIGKTPLVVKDKPGFVVNRILIPSINAAAFLLMDGVATAETIDSAMKLGANHPMGPFAIADLVGIDTCLKILKEMQSRLDENFLICPLFEKMVVEGNLGRKTGKGFYTYSPQFV